MATGHEPESRRVTAVMDARAEALTACSGTTFTIERGQMDAGVRHYILRAQRGGIAYLFQHRNMGLPRDQMEAFLTMLTDLCNIGLLPVKGHGPQGYEPKEHHL